MEKFTKSCYYNNGGQIDNYKNLHNSAKDSASKYTFVKMSVLQKRRPLINICLYGREGPLFFCLLRDLAGARPLGSPALLRSVRRRHFASVFPGHLPGMVWLSRTPAPALGGFVPNAGAGVYRLQREKKHAGYGLLQPYPACFLSPCPARQSPACVTASNLLTCRLPMIRGGRFVFFPQA